ncbi:hypothetical protein AHiyo4_08420 [Arthrobacter sp. Hiyo4]|nr:hypothetical protein AHiyo4_08420 [Arthrobacter sp. Hiyo4]
MRGVRRKALDKVSPSPPARKNAGKGEPEPEQRTCFRNGSGSRSFEWKDFSPSR